MAEKKIRIIRPTCVGMNRVAGAADGRDFFIRPTCVGMNRCGRAAA